MLSSQHIVLFPMLVYPAVLLVHSDLLLIQIYRLSHTAIVFLTKDCSILML